MTSLELQPCHLARGSAYARRLAMAVRPDHLDDPHGGGEHRRRCSATWPRSAIVPTTPTPASAPTSARAGWCTSPPCRPAPARHAELARPLPDAIADATARPALDAPGGGHRPRPRRPLGGRRVGHLVGQVALLPGADRGGGRRRRSGRAPALALFPTKALAHDQLRALTALELPGRGGRRLRRRRQPRGAHVGAQARVGRAHQPRDAPLRAAAAPRALGHLPRAACASSCSTSCTPSAACSAATSPSSLRRLRRLAVHHGADPVFICSSATIGAPQRLATAICGVDVHAGARRRLAERSAHGRPLAAAVARRAHRRPRLGAPRGGGA